MERVLFAPRALPPLPLDVAEDPGPYSDWVRRREEERRHTFQPRAGAGILHLVMIVSGEPPPETVQTLRGLQDQTSAHWVLTVVLHDSWRTAFTALLAVSGLQRTSQRVRVESSADASMPLALLSSGLAATMGSDVALIFPGDVWAPDAVAQLSSALSPDGVVYADEDTLTSSGGHIDPRLKPAYSPDFLLSSPYVGRPLAMGGNVISQLVDTQGTDTLQIEHDMALRACEVAQGVVHIAEVLCHRAAAAGDPPAEVDPDVRHITAALERRGEVAEVRPGPERGTFTLVRSDASPGKASIVIPFRDEPRLLRSCVHSIDATRDTQPMELVLIDNGSVQPETATLLEQLDDRPDVQLLADDRPFNWAGLNNAGAKSASGDVLIFLNNDIEACAPGWLTALCAQARRPDIGAVGARLLYPDRRLQHCGVVLGLGGAGGHLFVGLEPGKSGYLHMAVLARECAAVTGACLATRREIFDTLQGFDESLGVDLNDVDYCLRSQLGGWRVLFDPAAELIHHESPSRGTAGDVRDIVHFIDRWRDSILADDPFLNPHLTRVDSSCRLRGPNEKEWWHQWESTLTRP